MVFRDAGEKTESSAEHVRRLLQHAQGPTDSLWRRWFHAPGRRNVMVRPSDHKDGSTVLIFVVNYADQRLRDVATHGHKAGTAQQAFLSE